MNIGTCTVRLNVKLSLLDAIKCRIAGLANLQKKHKIPIMEVSTK